MKRYLISALAAICLLLALAAPTLAAAAPAITIYVDQELLASDQAPIIRENRVLVPMRAIFEALGARVDWEAQSKTIIATKGDQRIVLVAEQKEARKQWDNVNDDFKQATYDNPIVSDVPPLFEENRVFVPLRFVAQAFGAEVAWDNAQKQVRIQPALPGNAFILNNDTYSIDKKTGALRVKNAQGVTNEIAKLDLSLEDIDLVKLFLKLESVEKTAQGGYLVQLRYYFKDQSNWAALAHSYDYVSHYYIKEDNIIRSVYTEYAFFTQEKDTIITYTHNGSVYLPGKNKVLQIDAQSGALLQEYDLQALAKTDKICWYTFTNGKHMMIRAGANSPGVNLFPVVINLESGEITWLHEKLLPAEESTKYGHKESVDSGPTLEFKGEKDGVLYFTYTNPYADIKKELSYTLP